MSETHHYTFGFSEEYADNYDRIFRKAEMAKSMKLGGGGRFKKLVSKLKGKVSNPKAVAASIGRKKYGKAAMAKMASKGKRRAKKNK